MIFFKNTGGTVFKRLAYHIQPDRWPIWSRRVIHVYLSL